jgi:hypothetical protein
MQTFKFFPRSRTRYFLGIIAVFFSVIASDTTLKRVLIAGDSTTGEELGYSAITINLLADIAESMWAYVGAVPEPCPGECWDTMEYLLQDSIISKIVAFQPDVFHFNQGLNCLSWIDTLGDDEIDDRLDKFTSDISTFFSRLTDSLPTCTLIYATLLPTDSCAAPELKPELGCRRRNAMIKRFNEAAIAACDENSICVNDLYAFAIENEFSRRSDGTHYMPEANLRIGQRTAGIIRSAITGEQLNAPQNSSPRTPLTNGFGRDNKRLLKTIDVRGRTISLSDQKNLMRSGRGQSNYFPRISIIENVYGKREFAVSVQ